MLRRYLARTPRQEILRAVCKTLCYRTFMVLITVSVAWAVVGDVGAALDIGIVTNVVKTATYFGYERAWDRIEWGLSD